MTHETIVIPDIHGKFDRVKDIIASYEDNTDRLDVIYLGDYFDDWGDRPHHAAIAAKWLKNNVRYSTLSFEEFKKINPDETYISETFLLGNHDIPYLYHGIIEPFNLISCSGWTLAKQQAANQVFYDEQKRIREHMSLHAVVGSWLLTHAGVTNFWLEGEEDPMGASILNLNEAKSRMDSGYFDPLIGPKGCTWIRPNEFERTDGLNQMFGHTVGREPRFYDSATSHNICLDTNLRFHARYIPKYDNWEMVTL